MSETVKLIIEISTGGVFERDIYTPICADGFIRDEYNEKVAEAIKNGIPLDDVLAEIKEEITKGQAYSSITYISNVIEIIDKHISGEGNKE